MAKERIWLWDDNQTKTSGCGSIAGVAYKPIDRHGTTYNTNASIRISEDNYLVKLETTQYANCVVLTPAQARAFGADLLEAK